MLNIFKIKVKLQLKQIVANNISPKFLNDGISEMIFSKYFIGL